MSTVTARLYSHAGARGTRARTQLWRATSAPWKSAPRIWSFWWSAAPSRCLHPTHSRAAEGSPVRTRRTRGCDPRSDASSAADITARAWEAAWEAAATVCLLRSNPRLLAIRAVIETTPRAAHGGKGEWTRGPATPVWRESRVRLIPDTAPFTKPESCRALAGVATRRLLLISREPMQKPLAHGSGGDQGAVERLLLSAAV